jgi:hypothetical protein
MIDTCIVVHNGALGDFLLGWPALLSLARARPSMRRIWAGREEHSSWAAAAGWAPASAGLRRGVTALYRGTWPEPLAASEVVWFGLRSASVRRHLGERIVMDRRFWLVPGIPEAGTGQRVTPREAAQQALALRGVPWLQDWRGVWREAVGNQLPETDVRETDALLFPGAGHRAKQWGAVQFFELGRMLRDRGLRPVFVLGPAELERGLGKALRGRGPLPGALYPCDSLGSLGAMLAAARLVVGNDAGPMHLASMFGTPGVALFGPASRRQWGPEGVRCLAADVSCRPCTDTTADITCNAPVCMEALSVEQVWQAVSEVLDA